MLAVELRRAFVYQYRKRTEFPFIRLPMPLLPENRVSQETNPTCVDPGGTMGDTQLLGFQDRNLR